MFTSVLIANRGEIAVRIAKTLRNLGVRSVVVASIPDRRSLAVRSADASVLLDGYSAAETYLDVDAVIAAAKAEGCEAIHPGYGFLSERADFAQRCAAEGIVFVGPPPGVLRGLGDKAAARRLAVENGVPAVPGWDGADDDATLIREGERIGVPLMVKARGGGGGRGMREVFDLSQLPEALEGARREALSAFGDPGLLLEKLVTGAHHVEVQVLADAHGNVIHLGERDCSVQRRHQKLIEETPSPVVDEALRGQLTGSALRLARAIGYVNAGTFEFLVGEPGDDGARPFYFLEVNPRLQVEHPVTEMVTGLDLVELQLRIAAGESLPLRQEDVRFSGHAIEFRINAEDPWDGFKPSSGRITQVAVQMRRSERLESHRLDQGYEDGDRVPAQYDSLLMKSIAFGRDRAEALEDAEAATGLTIDGIRTNVELHRRILESEDFRAGCVSVDWLERHLGELTPTRLADEWWAAAALGLSGAGWPQFPGRSTNPFTAECVWLGANSSALWLAADSHTVEVQVGASFGGSGVVEVDGRPLEYRRVRTAEDGAEVRFGAQSEVFRAFRGYGAFGYIEVLGKGKVRRFDIVPPPPLPRRAHAAEEGVTAITAPLAGTVVDVRVAEGDVVEAGQVLMLLEAMKMEHRITAPDAGTVAKLAVGLRNVVREGDVLVELA